MLETLTNLKNNRIKAAPGGEASAEATQRMKKFLNGLAKKKPSLLSLFLYSLNSVQEEKINAWCFNNQYWLMIPFEFHFPTSCQQTSKGNGGW